MAVITSLRPNLSRAEAIAAFSEGWAGRLGGGELRSVAEAFVPFRLYEVVVQNGSRPQKSWFALDAVAGLLDPFQFVGPPAPAELPPLWARLLGAGGGGAPRGRGRGAAPLGGGQAPRALGGLPPPPRLRGGPTG